MRGVADFEFDGVSVEGRIAIVHADAEDIGLVLADQGGGGAQGAGLVLERDGDAGDAAIGPRSAMR